MNEQYSVENLNMLKQVERVYQLAIDCKKIFDKLFPDTKFYTYFDKAFSAKGAIKNYTVLRNFLQLFRVSEQKILERIELDWKRVEKNALSRAQDWDQFSREIAELEIMTNQFQIHDTYKNRQQDSNQNRYNPNEQEEEGEIEDEQESSLDQLEQARAQGLNVRQFQVCIPCKKPDYCCYKCKIKITCRHFTGDCLTNRHQNDCFAIEKIMQRGYEIYLQLQKENFVKFYFSLLFAINTIEVFQNLMKMQQDKDISLEDKQMYSDQLYAQSLQIVEWTQSLSNIKAKLEQIQKIDQEKFVILISEMRESEQSANEVQEYEYVDEEVIEPYTQKYDKIVSQSVDSDLPQKDIVHLKKPQPESALQQNEKTIAKVPTYLELRQNILIQQQNGSQRHQQQVFEEQKFAAKQAVTSQQLPNIPQENQTDQQLPQAEKTSQRYEVKISQSNFTFGGPNSQSYQRDEEFNDLPSSSTGNEQPKANQTTEQFSNQQATQNLTQEQQHRNKQTMDEAIVKNERQLMYPSSETQQKAERKIVSPELKQPQSPASINQATNNKTANYQQNYAEMIFGDRSPQQQNKVQQQQEQQQQRNNHQQQNQQIEQQQDKISIQKKQNVQNESAQSTSVEVKTQQEKFPQKQSYADYVVEKQTRQKTPLSIEEQHNKIIKYIKSKLDEFESQQIDYNPKEFLNKIVLDTSQLKNFDQEIIAIYTNNIFDIGSQIQETPKIAINILKAKISKEIDLTHQKCIKNNFGSVVKQIEKPQNLNEAGVRKAVIEYYKDIENNFKKNNGNQTQEEQQHNEQKINRPDIQAQINIQKPINQQQQDLTIQQKTQQPNKTADQARQSSEQLVVAQLPASNNIQQQQQNIMDPEVQEQEQQLQANKSIRNKTTRAPPLSTQLLEWELSQDWTIYRGYQYKIIDSQQELYLLNDPNKKKSTKKLQLKRFLELLPEGSKLLVRKKLKIGPKTKEIDTVKNQNSSNQIQIDDIQQQQANTQINQIISTDQIAASLVGQDQSGVQQHSFDISQENGQEKSNSTKKQSQLLQRFF